MTFLAVARLFAVASSTSHSFISSKKCRFVLICHNTCMLELEETEKLVDKIALHCNSTRIESKTLHSAHAFNSAFNENKSWNKLRNKFYFSWHIVCWSLVHVVKSFTVSSGGKLKKLLCMKMLFLAWRRLKLSHIVVHFCDWMLKCMRVIILS